MVHSLTRRSMCTLSALALASLWLPSRAFGLESDEKSGAGTNSLVIVHTNDVHCAVETDDENGNLGYAKLVDYVKQAKATYGDSNITLVDAGDAVQGRSIGTLTQGEYLVEIMNECNYDIAIPGNHEFDYGMTEFDTLVARANAKYLSCNFYDLRTNTLRLDPYSMRSYTTGAGTTNVAFIGICTPETLTKSAPSHFQDNTGNIIFGFCEDETGQKLYDAVQTAVNQARADGAHYVVALAHLGQGGTTSYWRSDAVVANTTGIDVLIDGHSHEEYIQTLPNKIGYDVLITQTGTELSSIGAVTIDPTAGTISASTPHCSATLVRQWDGVDKPTEEFVAQKLADLETITGRVIGRSDVRLIAFEEDNYTWAVRNRETNLGDFVTDAYLALAWRNGIMADVALVNGGGIRTNIEPGDVTYGNIIDVQPYNNQLCYVETKGQNILDALEMGSSHTPEQDGSFQHVAGLTYTVRTDIPSSVKLVNSQFAGVTGEYRVRDVMIEGSPLDVNKTYKMVSHTYLIVDGGGGMNMFKNDTATLIDLDSAALIEYVQYDLKGVIGSEYADENGQGRIILKAGPDPEPTPPMPDPSDPTSSDTKEETSSSKTDLLADTSDSAMQTAAIATSVGTAAALGIGAAALKLKANNLEE